MNNSNAGARTINSISLGWPKPPLARRRALMSRSALVGWVALRPPPWLGVTAAYPFPHPDRHASAVAPPPATNPRHHQSAPLPARSRRPPRSRPAATLAARSAQVGTFLTAASSGSVPTGSRTAGVAMETCTATPACSGAAGATDDRRWRRAGDAGAASGERRTGIAGVGPVPLAGSSRGSAPRTPARGLAPGLHSPRPPSGSEP